MPKFISDEEMEQLEGKKKRFISDDEMAAMDSQDHVYPQGEPTRITPRNPRASLTEAARGFSPARNIPLIGPLGERLGEGFRAGVESAFGDETYGDAYSRIRGQNEAEKARYARDYPGFDTGSKVLGAIGSGVFGAGGKNALTRIASTGAITGADTLAQGGGLEDAGKSGALGSGIQAGVEAVVPGVKKLRPLITTKGLQESAAMRALKSVYGNSVKAWRQTPEHQRVPLGLAALENKIVGFGTTANTSAKRAGKVASEAWDEASGAFKQMDDAGIKIRGERVAEEAQPFYDSLPGIPDLDPMRDALTKRMDYFRSRDFSPGELQELKKYYRYKIKEPGTHTLGEEGNNAINQAIARSIRRGIAQSGIPNADKFSDAYNLSGQAGQLQRFGKANADMMTKNRSLSLTDYIMLGSGAGIGAGIGQDASSAGVGGILMAFVNRIARTRGSSAMAKTLYNAAKVADMGPIPAARILEQLERGELVGPVGVMIADEVKKMMPVSEEQSDLGARIPDSEFMRDRSGLSEPIPGMAEFKRKLLGPETVAEEQVIGSPSDRDILRGLGEMLIPEQYGDLAPGMAALPPWVKRADGVIDMSKAKTALGKDILDVRKMGRYPKANRPLTEADADLLDDLFKEQNRMDRNHPKWFEVESAIDNLLGRKSTPAKQPSEPVKVFSDEDIFQYPLSKIRGKRIGDTVTIDGRDYEVIAARDGKAVLKRNQTWADLKKRGINVPQEFDTPDNVERLRPDPDLKQLQEGKKTFYEQLTGRNPEDAPEPVRFPGNKKPRDIDAEEQQLLDQVMKENPVKPEDEIKKFYGDRKPEKTRDFIWKNFEKEYGDSADIGEKITIDGKKYQVLGKDGKDYELRDITGQPNLSVAKKKKAPKSSSAEDYKKTLRTWGYIDNTDDFVAFTPLYGKKMKVDELEQRGFFNPVNGKFGESVREGGPDPFMWSDSKAGNGMRVLSENGKLKIYTKSDLLAHDDYIDKIKPGSEVVMVIPAVSERILRIIDPGSPSMKRRLNAVKKLNKAGIKTRIEWQSIEGLPTPIELSEDMMPSDLKTSLKLDNAQKEAIEKATGLKLRGVSEEQ